MQDIGDTHVYLDLRHLNARKIHKRFPFITEVCAGFHLDIAKDLIPVRPAAHYYLGGIRVDENGRSGLAGLFAAGEGAATGLHGANRLGSNSILEGMVFGSRTGQAAAAYAADLKEISRPKLKNKVDQGQFRSFAIDVNDARASLRALMWRQVGIERNGPALSAALERLEFWSSYMLGKEFADRNAWELQNMLLVARLATLAARLRCETRGVHYRTDNPDRDDKNWLRHISYHVRKK
jgi:L-aspartate oxidase